VHRFGVEDKIPKYDHMNFIVYNNLDILAIVILIIYLVFRSIKWIIVKCLSKIYAPVERVRDPNRPRRREKK